MEELTEALRVYLDSLNDIAKRCLLIKVDMARASKRWYENSTILMSFSTSMMFSIKNCGACPIPWRHRSRALSGRVIAADVPGVYMPACASSITL